MKTLITTLLLNLLAAACFSQSIEGTWKRVSTILEFANGTKEDLGKTLQTRLPCSVSTQYIFKKDGTHITQSPKGCEVLDKMSKSTWKQNGNTLTMVTATDQKLKTNGTSFTITFSGNTVTLVHIYTDAENKVPSTKTKKLTIVYQRI